MSWLYTIILYAKGTYYSRKLCTKKKGTDTGTTVNWPLNIRPQRFSFVFVLMQNKMTLQAKHSCSNM